jgi:hypothetical protein
VLVVALGLVFELRGLALGGLVPVRVVLLGGGDGARSPGIGLQGKRGQFKWVSGKHKINRQKKEEEKNPPK